MKRLLLLIFITSFFFSCGENLENKAKDLSAKKNYVSAVNTYKKLIQEQPEKADYYSAMAALNQLNNGLKIFDRFKKKNVDSGVSAYQTNYEKAVELLPEKVDSTSATALSSAFMDFANALHEAEAPNSVKASEWEALMMESVDKAGKIDPKNPVVSKFKEKVYTEKFAEAKAKGDEHYNTAKKKRSDYDYILAEDQYNYALKFKPDDKEIMDILSTIRKKTLDMWDPHYDFMFGIAKIDFVDDNTWLVVSIKNNSDLKFEFDPELFMLYDKNGDELPMNVDATSKEKNGFKAVTLKPMKEKDGLLAFKFKGKEAELGKLVYTTDSGEEITKYFP